VAAKQQKGGSEATERRQRSDGKVAAKRRKGGGGRFGARQVFREEERDIGSDPLLPVLAQKGQTPCRTVYLNEPWEAMGGV